MLASTEWNEELLNREWQIENQLAMRLMLRTGGRLRSLRVGTVGNQICVWGEAPTYHVRQLAEQAAISLVAANRLQLEIEVIPTLQWHQRAMAGDAFDSHGTHVGVGC